MQDFADGPAALPELFLERMQGILGGEFGPFADSYKEHEQVRGLRLNTLKLDPESALALCGRLFELVPVPWCGAGFYYAPGTRPGRHPWHEAGLYYIQEPSAMIAAALSGTKPGEKVLDLCAAPGGKTTALAAMLGGWGMLLANEIHPERAKILSQNVERMGIRNAVVTNETPEHLAERFGFFFDRVIVDAPCSGEGMFAKEPEALAHWSPENVAICAARQRDILESADRMLREGGVLVYSTCTFAPEEDEGTIGAFLAKHPEYHVIRDFAVSLPEGIDRGHPGWTLESAPFPEISGAVRLWPHRIKGEGHFACVLRKGEEESRQVFPETAGTGKAYAGDRPAAAGLSLTGKAGAKPDGNSALWSAFAPEFLREGVLSSGNAGTAGRIIRYGDEFYLLPGGIEESDLAGIRVLRAGLDLGGIVGAGDKGNSSSNRRDSGAKRGKAEEKLKRGELRFEPSHALAMALKPEEAAAAVDFAADSPEIRAFFRGEALRPESGEPIANGWVLVTVDGISAGWCKAAGGVLKNHYPRGLRREVQA